MDPDYWLWAVEAEKELWAVESDLVFGLLYVAVLKAEQMTVRMLPRACCLLAHISSFSH